MYEFEIQQASQITGVEPAFLAAIIMQESAFKANAVYTDTDGHSSFGPMQIRLPTAKDMLRNNNVTGEMLLKPQIGILAGAHYLRQRLSKYGNKRDAAAAYNAGEARKNAFGEYTNSKGVTSVDKYVTRVMNFYNEYKKSGAPYKPIYLASLKSSKMSLTPLLIGVGVVGLIYMKGDNYE